MGAVLERKWRLERILGSGGMATVYAATHCNNGRSAAIKLLHAELAGNAEIRTRFAREGYIANKVGHPGAVAVLDDGVEDSGCPFLVMDLLVGQSLHERMTSAPAGLLSEAEVLRIAEGMLDVLAAAHEQGIVHRDLKPDNVFLAEDGAIKILDFGIAHLADRSRGEKATQTGLLIGTPGYMPPEQARGYSKLVDGRSDLWSVGAILFTLLTGRRVHEGETPNETLLQAMTAHAPPLADVRSTTSPDVAALIDRALAFEPDDRWRDAAAMRKAVREARAEVSAGPAAEAAGAATSSLRALPTPVTTTPMVTDVRAPRSGPGRALLVGLVLGAGVLGASVYAPREWRRVRDEVTWLAPALARGDAEPVAAHDGSSQPSTTAPASELPAHTKNDGGAPLHPSSPRSKPQIRAKSSR